MMRKRVEVLRCDPASATDPKGLASRRARERAPLGVRGEGNYEKKVNLALLDLIEAQIHFYLLYTLYLY